MEPIAKGYDGLGSEYVGFSCPREKFDSDSLVNLSVAYACSVIDVFLETFAGDLSAFRGVVEILRTLPSCVSFGASWSPVLGLCLSAVTRSESSLAAVAAAKYLVHLGSWGVTGDWNITLPAPIRLTWSSWLLPETRDLVVRCTPDRAEITLSATRDTFVFVRDASYSWTTSHPAALLLPHVSFGSVASINLLGKTTVDSDLSLDVGAPIVERVNAADSDALARSVELLYTTFPAYYVWIARVLRSIVLVESGERGFLRSGSDKTSLGCVYISNNKDLASIGEMLIHEATHNYFYLLTQMGGPVTGGSDGLYYSPFVHSMRPLDRILLAYHAFANVYLYYTEYEPIAPDPADISIRRARVLKDLDTIVVHIKDNMASLTRVGLALVEPLIRHVASCPA
jgi:HEXXH motif-containing protein